VSTGSTDWRLAIPETRRGPIRAWLWAVAAMTFAVIIIGAITRLTLSGLSIVEWRPFSGVIPPIGEHAWQRVFEQYQQYPEYRTWRSAMTLAEFKSIFMWEYLHRIAARTIGLVFLLPFLFFWIRGWFNRPMLRRALMLFLLGVMQGFMGWFMVMSGLVDRPSVSHFRLAAHFSLALIIFGYALWLARELRTSATPTYVAGGERRLMMRWLTVTGVVLAVQVVWGAFTAGLKAGKYYPTFPLMGGRLVPQEVLSGGSIAHGLITHPVSVQWAHRVIGTILALIIIALFIRVRRAVDDPTSRHLSLCLLLLIGLQYTLGVLTVLHAVPVTLGVLHQAIAVVTVGVWLTWLHHVHNLQPDFTSPR
jgi:cytochrome c oxidase assembly protein subunit 15